DNRSITHIIPAIDNYSMPSNVAHIVGSVLERADKEYILKADMCISADVGEYLTSVISCSPKHDVLAGDRPGPVVGDEQSLRSDLRRSYVGGSMSTNRRVLD